MRSLILWVFVCSTSFAALPKFTKDPDLAFRRAKSQKKPLLITFNAIWCPPCNQLEEVVYESSRFLKTAQQFELLQVDADNKKSWKLKDRYRVGGYPTVVFANSAGEEMYRVVGFRELNEFLRIMRLVVNSKGKSFIDACKSGKTDDIWRCAQVCRERKDLACAAQAYKRLEKSLPKGSSRYEEAEGFFVENAKTKDLQFHGLERLIKKYPSSPRALLWSLDYFSMIDSDSKRKPNKKAILAITKNSQKMIRDKRLADTGLTESDVYQLTAELLKRIGHTKSAKAHWKKASAHLEKMAKKLPNGTAARAFALERIYVLKSAGDVKTAMKIAAQYQAKYPEEFTFYFVNGRLLEGQKKFREALPVIEKAYELSYGDNKIRVATLLIRTYSAVGAKKKAKKIGTEIKKEFDPKGLKVRTHRYLKRLDQELKKSQA